MYNSLLLFATICACFFGSLGFILGIFAVVRVEAMKASTHTVQWMPIQSGDDWATSETAIEKQNKLYEKDLKEQLPEFALDEEDKKIFSF